MILKSLGQASLPRSKEKLEQNFPIYNNRAETLHYEMIDVSTLVNIFRDVAI